MAAIPSPSFRIPGGCKAVIAAGITAFNIGALADSSAILPPQSHSATLVAPIADTLIAAKVKSRFAADTRLQGSDISIDAINGVVTLTGSASTLDAWSVAEIIASGVDGVRIVDNQLKVPPPAPSSPFPPPTRPLK